LDDSKCKRKCDIFLSPTIVGDQGQALSLPQDYKNSWCNVLVPGELKKNPKEDTNPDTYIQLAGYVREVFGAQYGRRYVHAFSICGDIMRCYVFDRGGGSISHTFHIRKNQKTFSLFVQILWSYVRMSPTQLGFDPTMQTESGEVFLPIKNNLTLHTFVTICGRRFWLLDVLFHQPAIVSRGTICWYAKDEATGKHCVIKDAWRSHTRESEGELFALAKANGVRGLPDCRFYEDVMVDGILDDLQKNVRKGLKYESSRVVKFPQKRLTDVVWMSMFDPNDAGTSRLSRLKVTEDNDAGLVSSISKLSIGHNRKSSMQKGSGLKKAKPYKEERNDWNRIHTRLVFYTIGRPIYRFRSSRQLLEALYDAINSKIHSLHRINRLNRKIGHRSLSRDGGILHRVVSTGT
jgi:hypothetical protein